LVFGNGKVVKREGKSEDLLMTNSIFSFESKREVRIGDKDRDIPGVPLEFRGFLF